MPNATTAKSAPSSFVTAKRGDLVMITRTSRSTSLYRGTGWYESIALGEVVSVSRTGVVNSYRNRGGSVIKVSGYDTVSIAPATHFSAAVSEIVNNVRITTSDDVRAQLRSFLLQRID